MRQETKDYLVAGGLAVGSLALLAASWRLKRRLGCQVTITTDLPIDDYAPLEPVQGCDPDPKPGVLAFRDMVLAVAHGTDLGISRDCDQGAESKHHEGRAWDWGPPSKAVGDAWVSCMTSPDASGNEDAIARRAGVRVIIWQRKIWTATAKRWAPYDKPGGDPHTGHVHFDFSWKGANAQTSLYSILEDGTVQAEAEPTGDEPRYLELLHANGLEGTSNHFRVRLIEVARELGLDAGLLAVVMSQETGGKFAPGYYPSSHRVGLIQWSRASASWIGTSFEALLRMTAAQQLEWVGRWYKRIGPEKIKRPVDYRLAVFAPAAVGRSLDAVVYDDPKLVASNVGFDVAPKDGVITVGEVGTIFDQSIAAAKSRPPILVDTNDTKHKAARAALILAALSAAGCSVYLDRAE